MRSNPQWMLLVTLVHALRKKSCHCVEHPWTFLHDKNQKITQKKRVVRMKLGPDQ